MRLKNRISNMPSNRWPKRVWEYDPVTNTDAWFKDVQFILSFAGITGPNAVDSQINLDDRKSKLMAHSK